MIGARVPRCGALASLFVPLLAADCTSGGGNDPCRGVDCGGHGVCVVEDDSPLCLCYRGYHPSLLACVANDPGDPCLGVTCSGHGRCRPEDGLPVCDCDPGFHRHPGSDLLCLPDQRPDADAGDDAPFDEVGAEDALLDELGAEDAPLDGLEAGEADGDAGPCSAPGAPAPLRPPNGARTGSFRAPASFGTLRPLFRWRPPPDDGCGAPTYEIQVDDSCVTPGFEACVFTYPEAAADGIGATEWRPPVDLAVSAVQPVGTRYYWRVRACRGAWCSPWSRVRYVDVGRSPGDVNGDGFADVVVGATNGSHTFGAPCYGFCGGMHLYLGGGAPDADSDLFVSGADVERLPEGYWVGPFGYSVGHGAAGGP
jgi:hypothetical protein